MMIILKYKYIYKLYIYRSDNLFKGNKMNVQNIYILPGQQRGKHTLPSPVGTIRSLAVRGLSFNALLHIDKRLSKAKSQLEMHNVSVCPRRTRIRWHVGHSVNRWGHFGQSIITIMQLMKYITLHQVVSHTEKMNNGLARPHGPTGYLGTQSWCCSMRVSICSTSYCISNPFVIWL